MSWSSTVLKIDLISDSYVANATGSVKVVVPACISAVDMAASSAIDCGLCRIACAMAAAMQRWCAAMAAVMRGSISFMGEVVQHQPSVGRQGMSSAGTGYRWRCRACVKPPVHAHGEATRSGS